MKTEIHNKLADLTQTAGEYAELANGYWNAYLNDLRGPEAHKWLGHWNRNRSLRDEVEGKLYRALKANNLVSAKSQDFTATINSTESGDYIRLMNSKGELVE